MVDYAPQKGNNAAAEKLFLKVLQLQPKHAGSMIKLARYYYKQKRYDEAATYFEKFVNIFPTDIDALNSLGWTYYCLSSFEKAEKPFKTLTKLKPKTVSYWMNLGSVYANNNVQRYNETKMCYLKVKSLKPTPEQLQAINAKLTI